MKKWKCLVCGYIHEGDEPPEKCPVCGADASQFEELIEEDSPAEEAPAEAEPAEEAPVEEAPVEEPEAEEAAVEEAKEEEAYPEPAPEEEAPKAEEAVQEAPAEEAPLKSGVARFAITSMKALSRLKSARFAARTRASSWNSRTGTKFPPGRKKPLPQRKTSRRRKSRKLTKWKSPLAGIRLRSPSLCPLLKNMTHGCPCSLSITPIPLPCTFPTAWFPSP